MQVSRRTLSPWRDPRIDIQPSDIEGYGMFATERIKVGEVVVIWGGMLFTHADLDAGLADLSSVSRLDDDLYLGDMADNAEHPEDYYLNHSCYPNVWMLDEITLVACRTIRPGDELTADYALWATDPDWELTPCACGTQLCRGSITGEDWKLPELQERYGSHFSPYLNKQIALLA